MLPRGQPSKRKRRQYNMSEQVFTLNVDKQWLDSILVDHGYVPTAQLRGAVIDSLENSAAEVTESLVVAAAQKAVARG